MTIATLISARPVQIIVDQALDEVWRGRLALVNAFGPPARLRGANARPAGISYALTRVRRLMQLARYAFLIVAAWFDVAIPKRRKPGARAVRPASPPPSQGAPDGARSSVRFRVGRSYRSFNDYREKQPQPLALQHATRNPMRTLARHLETLAHVMLDPMPHVRRLARALRRGDIFCLRRAAKRPPRTDRRDHHEELTETRAHLAYELSQKRWQDSS